MSESCVLGGKSLSVSLSLLLPFPKTLGVSSTRIRHGHRLASYISSNIGPRLHDDMKEMAKLSLSRMK